MIGVLCALGLLTSVPAESPQPPRPNVVIILADDLGYADVGVHGSRDIPTPHIDSLAASGVRFASGYSAHPFCSPMRASLMVGRYHQRFGYERNIAYDPQNRHMGLPIEERSIAARLREAGYTTGMVGKWHLGAAAPFHPNRRGFDYFYGFLGGGHDYFRVDLRRPLAEGYLGALEENGRPEGLEGYLTTELSRRAVRFIEQRSEGDARETPFLLYVSYNAPHTPLQAPEEVLARFAGIENPKRRTYAAMVAAMDDGIGEILACLERRGLRERTIVFFLSDNGGPENANASRNDPLRGQKGDVYEGGIRVPFLASWPGRIPAGDVYEHPVSSIDVACTALALGGIDPVGVGLEGVNLVPHVLGAVDGPPHAALFWRKENGDAWAVRAGALKLLKRARSEALELYDLALDIGETEDVSANRPEEVARLRALYEAWNESNRPPFFPSYREYHQLLDRQHRELSAGAASEEAEAEPAEESTVPPRR